MSHYSEHKKKCKLGSQVKKLINENGIHQESLRSEYKEAKDVHLLYGVGTYSTELGSNTADNLRA